MDSKQLTSLKVWKQTQENLKILAALKRKTMLEVLNEIVDKELNQEQERREQHDQSV